MQTESATALLGKEALVMNVNMGGERTRAAREALLEGVGKEISESFPGITRLGGQIVAALYLADGPLSMDTLSADLGRSKSNIFANLRALEAAGIVMRTRESGTRYDTFALRGKYPDVVVGAYLARLRRVVHDKCALSKRALEIVGDEQGPEADALRERLTVLLRKYERFAKVFADLLPMADGPIDLEELIDGLPQAALSAVATSALKALGFNGKK